jgi:hypothetical protein
MAMSRRSRGKLVVAGALLAGVIPWAQEAAAEPLPRYATDPEPKQSPHSNPEMMVAGIVITSVSGPCLPVGSILLVLGGLGLFGPTTEFSIGVGLLSVGSILPAIGVPLWVNGAKKPKRWWEKATIVPGPRGVALRWALPL